VDGTKRVERWNDQQRTLTGHIAALYILGEGRKIQSRLPGISLGRSKGKRLAPTVPEMGS